MKSFAKLIYRSNVTYFPSKLPVQFYGLPDGKVYVVYARFYEIQHDRTYLEFVFAEHKEFSYDFENEKLIPHCNWNAPVYNEIVDKPEPKVEIVKTFRNIRSFAEAFDQLNKKAKNIARNLNMKDKVQELSAGGSLTATA